MYHFWRQNPLFRPALCFVFGILVEELLEPGINCYKIATLLLLFWQCFDLFSGFIRVNLLIPCWFILLGAGFHFLQPKSYPLNQKEGFFLVEIKSPPIIKENKLDFVGEVLQERTRRIRPFPIQIHLKRNDSAKTASLTLGDRLIIYGEIREISGPKNPYSFNYAQFMQRKNIFHQLNCEAGNWTKISSVNSLFRMANSWRNWALERVDSTIKQASYRGILKALLCGDSRDLLPEVRALYAISGTMHMLAVSGMHVGILLVILRFLFQNSGSVVLKNLLLMICLWLYALLTGLSPSVLRAVCMASFYLIAECFQREHSSWNSLSFALLVLLIFNTHYLFNPGFQLSFLALSGILLVAGNYAKAKTFKEKSIHWFKSYLSVSLAAQAATAPIAIYYFDQFPVYFLLGNLLIVPLAAPMMYGGLLILLTSPIKPLSELIGFGVEKILSIDHAIARSIASLPNATAHGLNWDLGLVICFYLMLLGLILLVKVQKKSILLLSIGAMAIWSANNLKSHFEIYNQKGFILYSIWNKSSFDFYQGKQYLNIADSLNSKEENTMQPFRKAKGLNSQLNQFNQEFEWGQSIVIDSLRIVFYRGKDPWVFPKSEQNCVLILEKNSRGDLAALHESLNFRNIVLAGNLSYRSREQWLMQAAKLRIPVHDIRTDGAYHVELCKHSLSTKLRTVLGISH